jgi:hypothetical protein
MVEAGPLLHAGLTVVLASINEQAPSSGSGAPTLDDIRFISHSSKRKT